MLRHRIKILNRTEAAASKFGLDSAGVEWQDCGCFWAAVDGTKGMRALSEGALDAYSVVLVRMRWNSIVNMRSRMVHNGQTYQIIPETFLPDRHEDTIQFQAQVIINEQ